MKERGVIPDDVGTNMKEVVVVNFHAPEIILDKENIEEGDTFEQRRWEQDSECPIFLGELLADSNVVQDEPDYVAPTWSPADYIDNDDPTAHRDIVEEDLYGVIEIDNICSELKFDELENATDESCSKPLAQAIGESGEQEIDIMNLIESSAHCDEPCNQFDKTFEQCDEPSATACDQCDKVCEQSAKKFGLFDESCDQSDKTCEQCEETCDQSDKTYDQCEAPCDQSDKAFDSYDQVYDQIDVVNESSCENCVEKICNIPTDEFAAQSPDVAVGQSFDLETEHEIPRDTDNEEQARLESAVGVTQSDNIDCVDEALHMQGTIGTPGKTDENNNGPTKIEGAIAASEGGDVTVAGIIGKAALTLFEGLNFVSTEEDYEEIATEPVKVDPSEFINEERQLHGSNIAEGQANTDSSFLVDRKRPENDRQNLDELESGEVENRNTSAYFSDTSRVREEDDGIQQLECRGTPAVEFLPAESVMNGEPKETTAMQVDECDDGGDISQSNRLDMKDCLDSNVAELYSKSSLSLHTYEQQDTNKKMVDEDEVFEDENAHRNEACTENEDACQNEAAAKDKRSKGSYAKLKRQVKRKKPANEGQVQQRAKRFSFAGYHELERLKKEYDSTLAAFLKQRSKSLGL